MGIVFSSTPPDGKPYSSRPRRTAWPRPPFHGRVFRERDCADAAENKDARSESLDGGLKRKPREYIVPKVVDVSPEHGRRGTEEARILAIRTPPWLVTFVSALL